MKNPVPEQAVWMVVQEKCVPQMSIAATNMFVLMQMKVGSRNHFWYDIFIYLNLNKCLVFSFIAKHCKIITNIALATGTCMPSWGKKQGEHCYNDQDCESGFLCMGTGARRTCQSPNPGDKILGKLCNNLYNVSYFSNNLSHPLFVQHQKPLEWKEMVISHDM